MEPMGTKTRPPTVRQRRLAGELRALRHAAGMSREEVAKQTDINTATLYRIESAKVRPQRRTLMALLDKYGVTEENRRSELVSLAKHSSQLGWLQTFESELPELFTTYISFETDARSVFSYETGAIPGLLQTADYARAVITDGLPQVSAEEIEDRIVARLKRQDSFKKKDPLHLWAVIDEAALHRQVGGPKVMAEQLEYLTAVVNKPYITLQVLPFAGGAHPGMMGSFTLMHFPDPVDPSLVYIESMAGDLFLESEPDVRRYTGIMEHLRAAALNPADSVRLISKIAGTMQMPRGGAKSD